MAQTVVGIFDSAREAQDAVDKLVDKGFARDQVDLSTSTMTDSMDTTSTSTTHHRDKDDDGWGLGSFFGSLFGDDNDEARTYSNVGSRSSIVTVHVMSRDEAEDVADILDDCGAVNVNERASQYESGYSASGRTAGLTSSDLNTSDYATDTDLNRTTTSDYNLTSDTNRTADVDMDLTDRDYNRTTDADQRIPIIEEQMNVGKREVETGRVRVRSRIIERPVEESLRLRSERVFVHRNPVNRPATEADLAGFREGEIELTEHSEMPITSKEARVVEEVSLGKDVEERVETVRDTVRRTEVDIDDTTGQNLTTDQTSLRSGNTLGTDDYDSDTTLGNRPTNL